jgi:pyruvate dehydrogenase E1 component alpha subunit
MRQKRDPIENFALYLREGGHADEAALKAIDREIKDIVSEATEFAQSSPEPDPAELYTGVLIEA